MRRTIFYSWASDHPATNKKLIRKALDKAINALRKKGFDCHRDEATRGTPGSPDIPTTILEKVAAADALVADVSFIDRPESCNPNVIFELGFGWAHIGGSGIVTVFNDAYGKVSDLPFDIKTKRATRYHVDDPDADHSEAIKELAHQLTVALEQIFTAGLGAWAEDVAERLVELLVMHDEYEDRLSLAH